MSYYIIEFFKYEIAQGLYIVRDGPVHRHYTLKYIGRVSKLVAKVNLTCLKDLVGT